MPWIPWDPWGIRGCQHPPPWLEAALPQSPGGWCPSHFPTRPPSHGKSPPSPVQAPHPSLQPRLQISPPAAGNLAGQGGDGGSRHPPWAELSCCFRERRNGGRCRAPGRDIYLGDEFWSLPPPTPLGHTAGKAWKSLNASGSIAIMLKFRTRQGSRAQRGCRSHLASLLSTRFLQTCLRFVFVGGRSSSRGLDEERQDRQTVMALQSCGRNQVAAPSSRAEPSAATECMFFLGELLKIFKAN